MAEGNLLEVAKSLYGLPTRRGPDQDVPYYLIIWYISKTIDLL